MFLWCRGKVRFISSCAFLVAAGCDVLCPAKSLPVSVVVLVILNCFSAAALHLLLAAVVLFILCGSS